MTMFPFEVSVEKILQDPEPYVDVNRSSPRQV